MEAGRSRLQAASSNGGLSEPLPARTSIASTRAAPVLLTGAHRSGTTWVGTTLAADEQILYLPEPFNLDHLYPGLCGARFPFWFMRIDAVNDEAYRDTSADATTRVLLARCRRGDGTLAEGVSARGADRAGAAPGAGERCRPLVKTR